MSTTWQPSVAHLLAYWGSYQLPFKAWLACVVPTWQFFLHHSLAYTCLMTFHWKDHRIKLCMYSLTNLHVCIGQNHIMAIITDYPTTNQLYRLLICCEGIKHILSYCSKYFKLSEKVEILHASSNQWWHHCGVFELEFQWWALNFQK